MSPSTTADTGTLDGHGNADGEYESRIAMDWRYDPGLNTVVPLYERLREVLVGAQRLEIAVAYAKSSGVGRLLQLALPPGSRAVVGLGYALTDPPAVEQLAAAGVEVKCVVDTAELDSARYHPKLYSPTRQRDLVVLSGSANLTGGGLEGNVEQYEELCIPTPSVDANRQGERFERLWDHGRPLEGLRRSGDWEEYRQRARDRRRLERDHQRRLLRLNATTGRLIGQLARRDTRAKPGYLGITHPDWWQLQLGLREQADRALFWRRNTNDFKALANGGAFFHLVRDPSGDEALRAVQGLSSYTGHYEVATVEDLWRRYGELLGVHRLGGVYERLDVEPGRLISVIHLEQLTEFERPVPLAELRAHNIQFARNIVSGKSLTLEEVATLFELGGLNGATVARPATAAPAG